MIQMSFHLQYLSKMEVCAKSAAKYIRTKTNFQWFGGRGGQGLDPNEERAVPSVVML